MQLELIAYTSALVSPLMLATWWSAKWEIRHPPLPSKKIAIWQQLSEHQACVVCLPTFPKTYGIFCGYTANHCHDQLFEIPREIEVVIPLLNKAEKLIYGRGKICHLFDLEIPLASNVPAKIWHGIAPIVKHRFEVEQQILIMESNYSKTKELALLVQSSQLYSSYTVVFAKATQQYSTALSKLKQLRSQLDSYVRESLIAIKIAEFEVTDVSIKLAVLDTQLQTLHQHHQETKDFQSEYLELKHDFQSIR